MTPRWLAYARKYDGLREFPGSATNPTIKSWLQKLKAWWSDDETPWCGTFMAHVMQHCGFPIPKHWYRAKDWASWGVPCEPCVGAICVKLRKGGGHVFMAAGKGPGVIYGFGANQSNMVCVAPFNRSEIIAFRWPAGEPKGDPLPELKGGKTGVTEA